MDFNGLNRCFFPENYYPQTYRLNFFNFLTSNFSLMLPTSAWKKA